VQREGQAVLALPLVFAQLAEREVLAFSRENPRLLPDYRLLSWILMALAPLLSAVIRPG
jgi:hypothetical protein